MKKPLILACVLLPFCVDAQVSVKAVFTHWANATTATSYTGGAATGAATSAEAGNSFTYHFGTNVVTTNNIQYLDSFTTSLNINFHSQPVKEIVYFRRVDNASTTGLRKSLWYDLNTPANVNAGTTAGLIPPYDDSLERLFTEQIFNVGIDNNFENSTATNNNNIERVDVIFPGGISATDATKVGFAVFDRGNGGTHDPFYIAAVKTLDGSGNPSAYYNALLVGSTSYGSNVGGTLNFLVLRENPGDGHLLMMNNTANQDRDGVLVRYTDLGVADNTVIYGYSLFGTDVSVSPAANLVNYANGTNFPTNSDYTNGGLDQLAVTGVWVSNASYVVLADRVSDFGAVLTGGSVQLNWNLGVTDDLQEVVVERSGDGVNFIPLFDVGDPTSGQQTAVDADPLAGPNFYRLRLVNKEGAVVSYSVVCNVTTVATAAFALGVYPDPVQGKQLQLAAQGLKAQPYILRILDLSGKVILKQALTGSPALSLPVALPSWLPAGMYLLQLMDESGAAVAVKSFVVD